MKYHYILWLFCLIFPGWVSAQQFTAKIEDVGGYYRLAFTVAASGATDFTPPSLASFEILSGPSTSTFSNYQMINGRTSHSASTTFTYILSARKSGNITIGSASVRVDGRTLHSKPISLQAHSGNHGRQQDKTSNQSRRPTTTPQEEQLQQAGSSVTGRDLFIDVKPSRTKVMEQEAILLTYRIHARVGVGLANTQLTTKPDFKGIISHEIPLPGNQIQTTIEQLNGTTYKTGTILQYLIFPQQTGKVTIPGITFDCTVVQQDHHMDFADAFFNGGGHIGVQVRRTVPEMQLHVDALPQPKPASFSGAVGQFSIKGEVLNNSVKTNDVATYRITINGSGNMKLITPPTVTFPKDFDSYDAKTVDNTKVTTSGLSGQLRFDYTFVPRNVGSYDIPAVSFTYYDTQTQSYKTLTTSPIHLDVQQGRQSNADVDKQLAMLRSDIRDIHVQEEDNHLPAILTWGTTGYRLAELLLLILFGLSIVYLKRARHGELPGGKRQRNRNVRKAMDKLNKAEGLFPSQPGQAYSLLSSALNDFLCELLRIGQAELSRERLQQILHEKQVDETICRELLMLLDDCQYAQYAPTTENQGAECVIRARAIIKQMSNQNV